MNTTNTNNNSTTNTTTATSGNGGADIGGLSGSVGQILGLDARQILAQQAELLAKIELLIENQNRLELSFRDNLLNAAAISGVSARNQSSASV